MRLVEAFVVISVIRKKKKNKTLYAFNYRGDNAVIIMWKGSRFSK